jgi:serine/threonine-protein kinase HipA
MDERQAYVYIQLPGTLQSVPAGLLKVRKLEEGTYRGTFRYGDRYLERTDAVELDPFQLPLDSKVREFTKLKGLPGAVRDAAPDAWGRRVIEHKLHRDPTDFEEVEYLLHGPQDGAGYLSFGLKLEPPAPRRPYNRTHQLKDLIAAAEAVEDGRQVPEYLLEQLEPGTSMGGARPKATVEHEDRLWLAKFPERTDRMNLQRIEFATLDLARRCGINTCRSRLERVGRRDVLMLERFDRQRSGAGYLRPGFVSALTVLDAEDGYFGRDSWSYPKLADQLRRWSMRPKQDCIELYRRMVFNAAVTNNDDHPRNHALLRHEDGWRLSPGYDMVPAPLTSLEHRDLALTVGAHGRTASVFNLLSQSGRFGLSADEARAEIDSIIAIVKNWRRRFAACGVTKGDVEYIAPAMLPPSFLMESLPEPV